MKQFLSTIVRKVLPPGQLRGVENTYRRARAWLLGMWYGHPAKSLKVIAITGTNGKTTTAYFLNEMLKAGHYKTALFSTAVIELAGKKHLNDLNVTVASTGRMQQFFKQAKHAGVDFVILEATSHSLDQHKLAGVPIEVAVMTNLTQDHLDYHKTMQGYAAAKGKLFAKKPRIMVLNKDDAWFSYFNKYPAPQKLSYGKDASATVQMQNVHDTTVDVRLPTGDVVSVQSALPGEFNLYNLAAAASVASALGVAPSAIKKGAAAVTGIPGRFETVATNTPYKVVVDYAHTPDALEKLLTTAQHITKNNTLLVFGACGDRDKAKRPIMGEIAAKSANQIFLTDEESYSEDPDQIRAQILQGIQKAGGAAKTTEVPDRRQAIKQALETAKKGDTILITGMGHEQFRIIQGKKVPWNDVAVVQEILRG